MRYLSIIVLLAIVYIVFARISLNPPAKNPVTEGMEGVSTDSSPGPAHTNALKAPLDRTNEVLEQARKQKAADQF